MCKFKSAIILKNKIVLAPEGNESHSSLLESLNIEDGYINAIKKFVRAELVPKDNNKASDISEWKFIVDQDETPKWFNEDRARYEKEFRDAVRDYMKDKLHIICGYAWTPIKADGNKTYYLLDGHLEISNFGKNNNYAESYIREKLNNSELAKALKEKFGNKLIPITTDLLSLDGLDDYGETEGDILAIPTLDLYRECRKSIPGLDNWWWLATPNSTNSGCGSGNVGCVISRGFVDYRWCISSKAVRPFFILES